MSITFWAPDAPTYLVTPYPEDEPDYQEPRSELPEINLSNSNAYAMMQAMGIEPDYCGIWTVEQLPDMLARAMKLANVQELREPALAETVESGGELRPVQNEGGVVTLGKSARVISFGRSDDYVQSTALRFVELFKLAKERSFSVSWG